MVSLDAIARQVGSIAALLKLADAPRWRSGRTLSLLLLVRRAFL
jgi:hypothetical protein